MTCSQGQKKSVFPWKESYAHNSDECVLKEKWLGNMKPKRKV